MKDPAGFLLAVFMNLLIVAFVEFFCLIYYGAKEEAEAKGNDAHTVVIALVFGLIGFLLVVSVNFWKDVYSLSTGVLIEFFIMLVLFLVNGILALWLRSIAPIVATIISLIYLLVVSVFTFHYCKDGIAQYFANVQMQNSTQGKLETKLTELTQLSDKLKNKKEESANLMADYQQEISRLEREIRQEIKSAGVSNYSQASRNTRISYDLALIQKQKAYITKIVQLQERLNNGVLEMEFLQRSTEADLKMVRTFNEKEIADLTGRISTVIEKYLPDAGELVVNIDNSKLENPQKIWEDIVKSR